MIDPPVLVGWQALGCLKTIQSMTKRDLLSVLQLPQAILILSASTFYGYLYNKPLLVPSILYCYVITKGYEV